MEVTDQVGDFFFLGAYYVTKGYLEDYFYADAMRATS